MKNLVRWFHLTVREDSNQSLSVPKLLKFRLLFAYLLFSVDIGHLEQAGDGDFPSERWLGSGEIVSLRSDLVKKSRMCFRTATF